MHRVSIKLHFKKNCNDAFSNIEIIDENKIEVKQSRRTNTFQYVYSDKK